MSSNPHVIARLTPNQVLDRVMSILKQQYKLGDIHFKFPSDGLIYTNFQGVGVYQTVIEKILVYSRDQQISVIQISNSTIGVNVLDFTSDLKFIQSLQEILERYIGVLHIHKRSWFVRLMYYLATPFITVINILTKIVILLLWVTLLISKIVSLPFYIVFHIIMFMWRLPKHFDNFMVYIRGVFSVRIRNLCSRRRGREKLETW